ncbi:acetyl esterase [Pseudonocardia thermophila]|jgi:Esterase/lipase|uniref:Acetyl esterase n=1 Tax=Pseudonocardia thermophila TaxID=1848 RepID=A0A1M6UXD6_PSETH|nr:acetyl esterase [Pseudonocardia thermophila]
MASTLLRRRYLGHYPPWGPVTTPVIPVSDDRCVPLSPDAARLLAVLQERSPAVGTEVLDAPTARRLQAEAARRVPGPDLAEVTDRTIPGPPGAPEVPVRVYRPDPGVQGAPAVLYLHGGGWVLCDLDSHDAICRRLARDTGAVVVSVDYRRAPESPFPAALDDACAALGWLHDEAPALGVARERIAIAGDSAGGNLAAGVTLRVRDAGGPVVRCQVLVYPVTDCRFDTPSYLRFADGGGSLTLPKMRWYWDQYVPDGDRTNPYCSPLRAELAGLPPAFVAVAECDPLNSEGHAYAARLAASGVAVTTREYPAFHGFLGLHDQLPEARQAHADIAAWIAAQLREEQG